MSLSVPDTSVRVQRGIVSQYERGAAQESGAGGDLVDGAGKQVRRLIDLCIAEKFRSFNSGKFGAFGNFWR